MLFDSKNGILQNANYYLNPVYFDRDSNNALTRSGDLTGLADGKQGTISAWIRFDSYGDADWNVILGNNFSERFLLRREDTGLFRIRAGATSISDGLNMQADDDMTSTDDWFHVLMSWDLQNSVAHMYINDVDVTTNFTPTTNNVTIDYANGDWWVGSHDTANGTPNDGRFCGWLGQLYANLEEYVDLSVEANRRKFIDADGKPISLGNDGSLPTGNQPNILLELQDDEVASDFKTNKGDGGDFIEQGTVYMPVKLGDTDAVMLDGNASYLTRGGDFTSAGDMKQGILSCWVYPFERNSLHIIGDQTSGGNGYLSCQLLNNGGVQYRMYVASSPIALILESPNSNEIPLHQWSHILMSWDIAAGVGHIYVNDVQEEATKSFNNHAITVSRTQRYVGRGGNNTSNSFRGAMANMYYNISEYMDFTVEANRRKFIGADGLPVDLGSDGSTPTGNAPEMYLSGNISQFQTNKGDGGNFTIGAGKFNDFIVSPSD